MNLIEIAGAMLIGAAFALTALLLLEGEQSSQPGRRAAPSKEGT